MAELVADVKSMSFKQIHELVQKDRSNSIYWEKWQNQTVGEFGFPMVAFESLGTSQWTPFERYILITRMCTEENLKMLNSLVNHWDVDGQELVYNFDFMDEEEYKKKTTAEWDEFVTQLVARIKKDKFTPVNRLYLCEKGTWNRDNRNREGEMYEIKQKENIRTLIRGKGQGGITYLEILEACRVLFPCGDYCLIEKFKFEGFSPEGIPCLLVSTTWG